MRVLNTCLPITELIAMDVLRTLRIPSLYPKVYQLVIEPVTQQLYLYMNHINRECSSYIDITNYQPVNITEEFNTEPYSPPIIVLTNGKVLGDGYVAELSNFNNQWFFSIKYTESTLGDLNKVPDINSLTDHIDRLDPGERRQSIEVFIYEYLINKR
jgi:hypothetical protein